MRLAQYDDVVHTLTPDRPDQPFSEAILPGRGRCRRLVPDAHRAQSACDDGPVEPIPIANEVSRGIIVKKCLRYLTCNPFRCRMACNVDPDEVSTVQPNGDDGIEQVEANGRDNEKVHGGDISGMITQEGAPCHAWLGGPGADSTNPDAVKRHRPQSSPSPAH